MLPLPMQVGYCSQLKTCSNDPIISVVLVERLRTGRTILAGPVIRNSPGNCPPVRTGTRPISSVEGT